MYAADPGRQELRATEGFMTPKSEVSEAASSCAPLGMGRTSPGIPTWEVGKIIVFTRTELRVDDMLVFRCFQEGPSNFGKAVEIERLNPCMPAIE